MGEVYRARDTRLDRTVAIKVLPANFASDADRLQRFEQEARATSALNHPNILSIYDIGSHDGAPYIVAELLEGEELNEVLDGGALPVRKAIDCARQIAAGLAAAHEKGIVHRDLKPGNIFVTSDGRVKILDFGLAKLQAATLAAGAASETRTSPANLPLTNPGVVLGTAGYMSPEQVRGQIVDHRSDIFSLGVVLYEMLAGRKPFTGDSTIELMNAILKDDVPDLNAAGAKISPALENIMRRCLEKKPEHRFFSAHDLGFALEALATPVSSSNDHLSASTGALSGVASNAHWRHRLPWLVAGVLAITCAVLGWMYLHRPAAEVHTARLAFVPPSGVGFNDAQADTVVISPDGQKLAFTARAPNGHWLIWVRPLNSLEAQPILGSEDPLEPFWSPDSRSIAFGSQGKLKRVNLAGGSANVLCDAARMTGGTWSTKGVIVFGPNYGQALYQVPATGGEPTPATVLDAQRGDSMHFSPSFLPDGKTFIFRANTKGADNKSIWAATLDSKQIRQIFPRDIDQAAYAAPGWLLFVRNDALFAQAFDAERLQLQGEENLLITRPATNARPRSMFSTSKNGVLVWQGNWEREYQLVWFDRSGRQIGVLGPPSNVTGGEEQHISPDGKRVLLKRDLNLWVMDLARDTGIRLTSIFSQLPVWSPDGTEVAYNSSFNGVPGIVKKKANGINEAEPLLKGTMFPADWSRDGRFLFYLHRGEKTRLDVWVLPLFGDRHEYPVLDSAFDERGVQLSPDGRSLAYTSDETGRYEIYVRAFSADGKVGGEKKLISTSGGSEPEWRGDGRELFYVAEDGTMMSVAVQPKGAELEYSAPKALFKTRMLNLLQNFHQYDVTADGQRFLIGTMIGESKAPAPTVILNWTAELKK